MSLYSSLQFSAKVITRMCYKWEHNTHADGMLNITLIKI